MPSCYLHGRRGNGLLQWPPMRVQLPSSPTRLSSVTRCVVLMPRIHLRHFWERVRLTAISSTTIGQANRRLRNPSSHISLSPARRNNIIATISTSFRAGFSNLSPRCAAISCVSTNSSVSGSNNESSVLGEPSEIISRPMWSSSVAKSRSTHLKPSISIRRIFPESVSTSSKPAASSSRLDQQGDPIQVTGHLRKVKGRKPSLRSILRRYLEVTDMLRKSEGRSYQFTNAEILTLENGGFVGNDVSDWAFITTGDTTEEIVKRYVSSVSKHPPFLLLDILRHQDIHVAAFRQLLIDSWKRVMSKHNTNADSAVDSENLQTSDAQDVKGMFLEENAFMIMIFRLLYHARKVFPEAVSSICRMVPLYFQQANDCHSGQPLPVDFKKHKKLSIFFNDVIHRLSLPATLEPMKSMGHSWRAQQYLIGKANSFIPSLEIDRRSYRAIMRVMAASKKTKQERKFARLIKPSWPPWRKTLDGMDAERESEEDISRVVRVSLRMKEAGSNLEPIDKALSILGGREQDGTPTIQTRYLLKHRTRVIHLEWVARITATRNAQEAWAAFMAFEKSGRQPSLAMYYAMFEKLVSQKTLQNRQRHYISLPGDAKEALPVSDDNLSESERLRLQPPDIDQLYQKMLHYKVAPAGRCLDLLLTHASSMKSVIQYLYHSTLPRNSVKGLLGYPEYMKHDYLKLVPNSTFKAFIQVLCRYQLYQTKAGKELDNAILNGLDSMYGPIDRRKHPNFLSQAVELIRIRQPNYRPTWYALFSAIAHRNDLGGIGSPRGEPVNALHLWELLEACLKDSYRAGVELDPKGLLILCHGLEKALLAEAAKTDDIIVPRGLTVVKGVFHNLSKPEEEKFGLPCLSHNITGAHLHAYIRVLCIAADHDEILHVTKWISSHQTHLTASAEESANGLTLLRRTLVAIASLVGDKCDAPLLAEIKSLVGQIDGWGGWPTTEEVSEYKERGDLVHSH